MTFINCCQIRDESYRTAQKNFPADLVTFTEEILNGKLHFLCSVNSENLKKRNVWNQGLILVTYLRKNLNF